MRKRQIAALLLALLFISALVAESVDAAEPNFPARDSRYHNYPEMAIA